MDQPQFLAQCKEKGEGKNFAPELAGLLGMNLDAAYRRIRGATPLTYQEIQKICNHYNVSFDTAVNYNGRAHPFEFTPLFGTNGFDLHNHLSGILEQIRTYAQSDSTFMTLIAMDIPYFRQFGYTTLLRFKLFYWQRGILNMEGHRQKKFDPEACNEGIEEAMAEIYTLYHGIDSVEIWTAETLDSTLKQVMYGVDSGFFESMDDALAVCDDMEQLLKKLEREAMVSKKSLNSDIQSASGKFEIYQSDILLGTNTIQVQYNDEIYTYVGFNSFNSLMSKSPTFSDECTRWIGQVRAKSTLLSDVSEKLRYKFFQRLRAKIEKLRARIVAESAVE